MTVSLTSVDTVYTTTEALSVGRSHIFIRSGVFTRLKSIIRVNLAHLQVILSLERLPTHRAHIFPFIAVCQLVFCQRRGVAEDLGAHL